MAVALDKFVKQLEDSGILAGDTIKDFIPPKASPKDATELARELVRQKKLTKFQAEEVSKGKGKSLVLGNYVLIEQIGAGGMGHVFKAEHRRMKRIVAIKMLLVRSCSRSFEVVIFCNVRHSYNEYSHPAASTVDNPGRNVNKRPRRNGMFDSIQYHAAIAGQYVVKFSGSFVVMKDCAIDIYSMYPCNRRK